MAAKPFDFSLSKPWPPVSIDGIPTDAYLQVTALRFYRDEQLKKLQEEYQFCKEKTDPKPDMAFVQAMFNEVVCLNKMIESLIIEGGYSESYRL